MATLHSDLVVIEPHRPPAPWAGRVFFVRKLALFPPLCHTNAPLTEGVPVRMPGEQAERSIAAARERGVPLAGLTVQRLGGLAERFGLTVPSVL